MKKIIVALILAAMLLTGCGNMDMWDTVYTYDRAIIEMPGGEVIEVEIGKWCDHEGEQIQIIAKDGTIYLVSSFNCVLIAD
jgi:hypothetical protein